jgi:salicylate hydroxylase
MAAPCTREEASAALQGWGPHVTELAGLLPEKLTKYAVFDLADNPAPTYAAGRVCVAGDAAHASCPFHGAGAGMGVEDALVLAELLAHVQDMDMDMSVPVAAARPRALEAALQAYSAVRMERSQWVVQSSRAQGDILQWRHPDTGADAAKIKAEFERRTRKIWDFDVDAMVAEAKREYEARVGGDFLGVP